MRGILLGMRGLVRSYVTFAITLCCPMKFNLLHIGTLLGLIFNPKDKDKFYQTTRRYIPEGRPLHSHDHESLGSAYCLVHARSLPGLLFDTEGEDSMSSRNVS
jgi:hypothetical protein